MKNQIWKGANAAMFLAFVFGAVVQYNDPDPLLWILVYLSAAGASLVALLGSTRWEIPALVGAGTLIWGLTIAPRVIGQVPFMSMFGAFEMANLGIEESREMYGLFMIAGWCILVASMARCRARNAKDS